MTSFIGTSLLMLGSVVTLRASAFYLGDVEDPIPFGTANAGAAALAEEPGTVYANPAGMTRLDGVQASVNRAVLAIGIRFHNNGSNTAGFLPISGGEGGNAGEPGQSVLGRLAPSTFISLPVGKYLGSRFSLGSE